MKNIFQYTSWKKLQIIYKALGNITDHLEIEVNDTARSVQQTTELLGTQLLRDQTLDGCEL